MTPHAATSLERFNCGVDGAAYTAAVEALKVNGSPAIGAAQIVAVLRAVRAVVAPLPSSPLVGELREALEKYGRHLSTCEKTFADDRNQCTCGFKNAVTGAKERR